MIVNQQSSPVYDHRGNILSWSKRGYKNLGQWYIDISLLQSPKTN